MVTMNTMDPMYEMDAVGTMLEMNVMGGIQCY